MQGNQDQPLIAQEITRERRKKIPAITGIRGIAACWVVIFHYFYVASKGDGLEWMRHLPVIERGYLGVDLFFILSGFVLTMTYSKRFETLSLTAVKHFLIARIFRVFPLHWLMLAVFLSITPYMGGQWLFPENGAHNAKTFTLSIVLVQSWAMLPRVWNWPAWSLSNEWLAYIGFPLLSLIAWRARSWQVAAALAAAPLMLLTALCLASHQVGLDHTERLGLIRCLLEFPAGMLLCRMLQLRELTQPAAQKCLAAGVLLLAVALIDPRLDVLALPAFSLIIVACASHSNGAAAAFGNPVSNFLGEISYSIYLIHAAFFETATRFIALNHAGNPTARLIILGLACVAIVPTAYLTWRFVEIPGQAWGRKLIAQSRAKA